jgi:hypothetical protein
MNLIGDIKQGVEDAKDKIAQPILDYKKQLAIENKNLQDEIDKLQNEFNRFDRVNQYYTQDEVMIVYIQKILTVLYAVIYFGFMYFIAISNKHNVVKILWLLLFATLPFVVHIVTSYLYSTYLEILDEFKIGTVTRI